MCFSAEASFAVAAVLLPAGVYGTSIVATKRPAYLPLAITPIIFSFQQFAEGLVWVGLARGDALLVRVSALAFLAAAIIVLASAGLFVFGVGRIEAVKFEQAAA